MSSRARTHIHRDTPRRTTSAICPISVHNSFSSNNPITFMSSASCNLLMTSGMIFFERKHSSFVPERGISSDRWFAREKNKFCASERIHNPDWILISLSP